MSDNIQKIINIGSHKTGTTSLIKAMEILEYSSASEAWWYNATDDKKNEIINNSIQICNHVANSNYNLFEDSPYNFKNIYKELYNFNNDFKFILTIREEESWFNSLLYSTYYNPHLGKVDYKNDLTLQYLYGDVTEENRKKIINIYNKRNNEIIDFFKEKQKDLCIITLEDSDISKWKKLTTFLNIPEKFNLVKDLKYPHLNKKTNVT